MSVGTDIEGIRAIGQFSARRVAAMAKRTDKIVFVDSSPDAVKYCSVQANYETGVVQGIDYLIAMGHDKIAFVGPKETTDSKGNKAPEMRRRIFKDIAKQYGDKFEPFYVETDTKGNNAMEMVQEFILNSKDARNVTAYFAFNETCAINVMRQFQSIGIKIPDEVSVLGFNDTVLATYTQPQLSGIHIYMDEMAKVAVNTMSQLFYDGDMMPIRILVPTGLVERESVKRL